MKRNKTSTKAMRRRNTEAAAKTSSSRYALKVRGRKQMYGPGCCGHRFVKR